MERLASTARSAWAAGSGSSSRPRTRAAREQHLDTRSTSYLNRTGIGRGAAPRAVERRAPCHAARPVNRARMCHAVDEVAAADNLRCGRPRIGPVEAASPARVSASLRDSPNRDRAQPRLRPSPRWFSPAWWLRTHDATPFGVKTYAFGLPQDDPDRATLISPEMPGSAGWPSVEADASRRGSGVKGGEAAEGHP